MESREWFYQPALIPWHLSSCTQNRTESEFNEMQRCLVSLRTFGVMIVWPELISMHASHQLRHQATLLHIMQLVSLLIADGHLIVLGHLWRYVWVNILTLSSPRVHSIEGNHCNLNYRVSHSRNRLHFCIVCLITQVAQSFGQHWLGNMINQGNKRKIVSVHL